MNLYRFRHRFGTAAVTHPNETQPKRELIRIALAGNPNAGKTCLFNAITGQHQRVGNYPGVTVEKKTGRILFQNRLIELIDLPGTYSLSAFSQEEIVARDFLLSDKPDVVIDVLDATNLERHLYLLLQFQELGVPLVGALNMADEAAANGITIDVANLSKILGIPLVPTVGNRGQGISELLKAALDLYDGRLTSSQRHMNYGQHVEYAHELIIAALERDTHFVQKYPAHWMAIKLLEEDQDAYHKVRAFHREAEVVLQEAEKARAYLAKQYHGDSRTVVSEQRYAYIHGALRETVKFTESKQKSDLTEKIDQVVLHRFWGIPIFLGVMFLIYQFTFRLGNPLAELIRLGFEGMARLATLLLPDGLVRDLCVDGIIKGVGSVVTFLPLVVLLMMGLAFLEDTGYMARAAFVMDKFFHLFGLHGRSFMPFMVATGCAVPGVMSARLLANPKDRIVTILVTPFMMCGAKAPVIAILAAAFFPRHSAEVFWGVWLSSWLMAFIVALVFRRTLFRGEQTPFVMELPPYRLPTLQTIFLHMWEKAREYLKKAGTLILAASIVVWFLFNFPQTTDTVVKPMNPNAQTETTHRSRTYAVRLGEALEPVLKWAGQDWKVGVALCAGVAAKEVIIATFGILYSQNVAHDEESGDSPGGSVQQMLSLDPAYSPASGLALIIFIMFYTPCLATLAVIRKELGSWQWTLFQAGYSLVLAYFLALLVFQVGLLIGG